MEINTAGMRASVRAVRQGRGDCRCVGSVSPTVSLSRLTPIDTNTCGYRRKSNPWQPRPGVLMVRDEIKTGMLQWIVATGNFINTL
jgi:hypothetical protein